MDKTSTSFQSIGPDLTKYRGGWLCLRVPIRGSSHSLGVCRLRPVIWSLTPRANSPELFVAQTLSFHLLPNNSASAMLSFIYIEPMVVTQ